MVRSNTDRLNRKKINILIIIDVHARDLIDYFVRDSFFDVIEFHWDRTTDEFAIRQCTSTFKTAYEYMGLNVHLIIMTHMPSVAHQLVMHVHKNNF